MGIKLARITTLIAITGLALMLAHCGKKSGGRASAKPKSGGPTSELGTADVKDLTPKTEEGDLFGDDSVGPDALLLDAPTLCRMYSSVFGTSDAPSGRTGDYFSQNPTRCFNEFVDDANLNTKNFRPLDVRLDRKESLSTVTTAYLRSLRDYLVRACSGLATRELASLDQPTANRLIKRVGIIKADELSAFMTLIFGYSPDKDSLHEGAAAYVKAMSESETAWLAENGLGQASAADRAVNPAYRNFILELHAFTCVAVGLDVRAFMK